MPTKESVAKYGSYKNDQRVCPSCKKTFFTQKWNKQKFCSIKCGLKPRHVFYESRKCPQCRVIFQIEKWKKKKFCSFECGIEFNRGKKKKGRKKSSNKFKKWRPQLVTSKGRRIYIHRYLIEQKIGRQLSSNETVHHIDLNKENNNIENLWLYKNESDHIKGHHSIEKLIVSLLQKDIIEFINGSYLLKRAIT